MSFFMSIKHMHYLSDSSFVTSYFSIRFGVGARPPLPWRFLQACEVATLCSSSVPSVRKGGALEGNPLLPTEFPIINV